MLINSKIDFSIGTLLGCLELLPGLTKYSQFLKDVQGNCRIESTSFYNLIEFRANFAKDKKEKASALANAAALSLLKNVFFTSIVDKKNNKSKGNAEMSSRHLDTLNDNINNHINKDNIEMAGFFFSDLVDALNVDLKVIGAHDRNYLKSLMEWPTCATADIYEDKDFERFVSSDAWQCEWQKQFPHNSVSEEAEEFWKTCYYCFKKLFEEALNIQTNKKDEDSEFWETYGKWMKEIRDAKKSYIEFFSLPQNKRPSHEGLLKMFLESRGGTVPKMREDMNDKADIYTGLDELMHIFPGIKVRYRTLELKNNKKDFRACGQPYTDSSGIKRLVDFEEVIPTPDHGSLYRYDRFNIEHSDDIIDIKEMGIPYVKEQYNELRISVKVHSAKNSEYLPVSYRKINIDSLIRILDAGNTDMFTYKMHVTPIQYFDHRIMRDYFNRTDIEDDTFQAEKRKFISGAGFSSMGFKKTSGFFFLAGCGVWVISKDNYLMVSRRGDILEGPGDAGYTASGSCEYTARRKKGAGVNQLEADPFKTAARELYEECNIDIEPDELLLISLGIEYERFLEQSSFYYRSDMLADEILEKAAGSKSINEQILFAIPFTTERPENIITLIDRFEMEPGAIVSLIRLWEWLKANPGN